MQIIRDWFSRTFNDPQVVVLGLVLLLGFGVVLFMGNMLAPVLASLVLAYLLEGFVRYLERWRVPRLAAVTVVFLSFTAFLLALFLILFPVLYRQTVQLVEQLPAILARGQALLLQLPEHYPQLFSEGQMREIVDGLRRELIDWAQRMVTSFSFQSVVVVVTLLVYMVLVPFMVFFFLKDKRLMLQWLSDHLPRHRGLASEVWREVDLQIGNYVRGKFVEIIIVWAVTFITFSLFGLQFAMLLAVMVGLSVIVPYVGAAVVTLPVAVIAYFQWGLSPEFAWLMVAYFVIQALDGNVLVPLLFSEAVNLHPVAIIVAILVFGGLWGFWGVFFAIPLATLIQAVIKAWPSAAGHREQVEGEA